MITLKNQGFSREKSWDFAPKAQDLKEDLEAQEGICRALRSEIDRMEEEVRRRDLPSRKQGFSSNFHGEILNDLDAQ